MANDIFYRTATFERESINAEKRTVTLSISSDAPVDMGRGLEILDHSPDSIDLSRLRTGSPLLFNHDKNQHLGRITDAATDGRKLRVTAQISRSGLGAQKWDDINDGILQEASVGYRVDTSSIKEEGKDTSSGQRKYRVMRWTPSEGSLVSMPADATVGIGRSEPEVVAASSTESSVTLVDTTSNSETTRTTTPPPMAETVTPPVAPVIDIVKERETAVADHISRCEKIDAFVDAIKQPKWQEAAREIARKSKKGDANFDAFRAEAVNSFDPAKHIDVPDTKLGLSRKERKQFSVRKLILDLATGKDKGFEMEACDAAREKLREFGDNTLDRREGFTLPEDIRQSNLAEDNDLGQTQVEHYRDEVRQLVRGLSASTQNLGGYLIGTDLMTGSIIELLRNKAIMSQLGITQLSGLVNNVAIPRVLTGATVYWLSEAASVTASAQTFGQLTLTPHRMGADTFYTKQLLAQASLSVEAFVRDDLARQMAVELDRVYINGTGIGGEPQGIINTSGVGSITFSAAATWAKILTMESDVATANADTGSMVFITTPATRAKWKAATKISASSYSDFLWEKGVGKPGTAGPSGEVNGYPAYATNQVPSNKVILFVPSEFIGAQWAGVDIVVDPYSLKKTEQIEVCTHSYHDCGVRHPLAFEVSTDSGAQ